MAAVTVKIDQRELDNEFKSMVSSIEKRMNNLIEQYFSKAVEIAMKFMKEDFIEISKSFRSNLFKDLSIGENLIGIIDNSDNVTDLIWQPVIAEWIDDFFSINEEQINELVQTFEDNFEKSKKQTKDTIVYILKDKKVRRETANRGEKLLSISSSAMSLDEFLKPAGMNVEMLADKAIAKASPDIEKLFKQMKSDIIKGLREG